MLRKLLFAMCLVLSLGIIIIVSCYYIIEIRGAEKIISAEGLSKRDAIVVLGARVYADGTPSPMLRDRLDKAAELYHRGVANKILVTGDHCKKEYDEVKGMKDYLMQIGIPAEDIYKDHAGVDTYDSVYRSKEIFCVERPVYVTQAYHLKRTLYIAEALGIDAVGVATEEKHYAGSFQRSVREHLSRVKAVIECVIKPPPKLLGDKIPLSSPAALTEG